ncbi:Uncharacterised protein [Bordetella pertussis]|nr:Uncharacterised protein [Bordetella pertussis]
MAHDEVPVPPWGLAPARFHGVCPCVRLSPLGQAHCRTPSTLAGDHAEGVRPSRS